MIDFGSDLTAAERDFFVSVSCAPYLFRDCSYTLEQYWKSTRLHKEHFPSRLALKNRIGREAELRKLRSVNVLLEKARDPTIEKRVLENATNGMKVLNDLMDNANVCAKRMRIAERPVSECRPTAFFGNEGLPHEIQSKILLMSVQAAFSNPDSRAAHRQFASIRSACSAFRTEATLLGDELVSDVIDDIQRFVSTGRSRRTELGSSWIYRELACPPSMIMRGLAGHSHTCLIYMRERMRANLSENICKERGKVVLQEGNDALRPKSARLDRLLKIAYEVESV